MTNKYNILATVAVIAAALYIFVGSMLHPLVETGLFGLWVTCLLCAIAEADNKDDR